MSKEFLSFSLIGYEDNSFARDLEDRKWVIGYCFFINGAVVLWCSKKQSTISTLTTEAKYIALGHVGRETILICRFINKMNLNVAMIENVILNSNNKISITLTNNAKNQHQIKHIDIQHHYIQNWSAKENSLSNKSQALRC